MHLPSPETLALLEYRLKSVALGHLALRHKMTWDTPPAIKIYFDDKQVIEGAATAFTNGAIECAIVHCRALLEFLGLGVKNPTELVVRPSRQKSDVGIEQFGGLNKVSVEEAVCSYDGSKTHAEKALAYVIYLANKGLAHTTSTFNSHDDGINLLEIAFRGVPVVMLNNFYKPLGLAAPIYEFQSRNRTEYLDMRSTRKL
jgi:hypothetical protein